MRASLFLAPAVLMSLLGPLLAPARGAQLNELFSRHVTVYKPDGDFAELLAKTVPAAGDEWKTVEDSARGFQILVPSGAKPEASADGTRALQVQIADTPSRPRPVFRIDAFPRGKDEPEIVDQDYATEYAERYPEAAFAGKFQVVESGFVVLNGRKKTPMALVGGTYLVGAATAHRVQLAHLGKERHVFLTFDCAENEWARYQETVARMVLSFDPNRRRPR